METETMDTPAEQTGTLDTPETPVESGAPTEVIEPAKEAEQDAIPAVKGKGKATIQEILDWTKDPRAKTMWNEKKVPNPNKMYKSYRDLEKWKADVHDPLKKQYDTLVSTLKDEGYSLEQIKDVLTELKSWKDPNNVVVQNGNFVNEWMQHPVYGEKIISFFKELNKQKLQEQYPNMTEEQIQKEVKRQNELDELKTWKQQQEQEKMVSDYRQTINTSMDNIKKLAESRGFNFDVEAQKAFYDHCIKNSIEPKYMLHEFRNLHDEALEKTNRERLQNEILANVKKNKGASIIDGKPAVQKASVDDSEPDGIFRSAVRKFMAR